MNRLEWVEKKMDSYKDDGVWKRKFEKKWFGVCHNEVVTISSIISLNKNITKMIMEDI